jgi:hypothetical protein
VSEDGRVSDHWLPPNPDTHEAGDWSYYVQADELARGWRPPVREPLADRVRRHATAFLAPALLLPLLGAPVALLWREVTPRVGIAQTAAGPVPTAGESDQFFAIEGWFVVVTLVVGLVLGGVAWRFLRGRGPFSAAGVALGGALASGVTAIVGSRLVVDSYMYGYCHQPGYDCSIYDGTMTLRAPAGIVAWPVGMLLVFTLLTLARERDS